MDPNTTTDQVPVPNVPVPNVPVSDPMAQQAPVDPTPVSVPTEPVPTEPVATVPEPAPVTPDFQQVEETTPGIGIVTNGATTTTIPTEPVQPGTTA